MLHGSTVKQAEEALIEVGTDYNTVCDACPHQLSGEFEHLILDQGHGIRNLSRENGHAVLNTNARYRHIITKATYHHMKSTFAENICMESSLSNYFHKSRE